MTKFLTLPCPYTDCAKPTVQRVTETKCICKSCRRKVGYKVITHVDETTAYELTRLGRQSAGKTFMFSDRFPIRWKGISRHAVRLAIDTAIKDGKIIL